MNTIDSNHNNEMNLDEVTPPFPLPGNPGGGLTTDEITPPFPGSPDKDDEPDIK